MIEKLSIKKHGIRLGFILLLSCFVTLVNAEHGIWIVKKGDQQFTIAALPYSIRQSDWPLSKSYQKVFNDSKQIIFEDIIDGVLADLNQRLIHSQMMLPQEESLKDKLSEDIWNQLLSYQDKSVLFKKEILKGFSSTAVCVLLQVNKNNELGYTFQVSKAIYDQAKQEDKIIISLAGLLKDWEYIRVTNGIDSEKLIRACLDVIASDYPTADQYTKAVYEGDLKRLNKWYHENEVIKLTSPNETKKRYINSYIKEIDKLSRDNVSTVIYMGMSSLLGSDGLFSLLQEKGYQISKYQE